MADVINLNQYRKQRMKDRTGERGQQNRYQFGRTRQERDRVQHDLERRRSELDGKRLGDGPGGDGRKPE